MMHVRVATPAPAPVERPETWEFFSHHAIRSRADTIAAELNRRSALWVYRVVQSGLKFTIERKFG